MWKIVRSKQKMLDKIVRKENNVTRSGMAADMLCSRNATTCCVSAARKKTAKLQLSKDVRRWVKSDFFFFGEDRLWVKSDFFFLSVKIVMNRGCITMLATVVHASAVLLVLAWHAYNV
jgi:hypothetical protein